MTPYALCPGALEGRKREQPSETVVLTAQELHALLLCTESDEYSDCLVQKTHTPKSWKWMLMMFAQHHGSTCCLVSKSCWMLCNSVDCSTPGFPVPHCHWVCSNSCPLSQWVYPTISPSATLFSSSFSLSQHQGIFHWVDSASGGQNIGVSASASVLPVNIQGWFPLGLTNLISLLSTAVFNATELYMKWFKW